MGRALRVAEVRTEHLLTELLESQGWDCRRPPAGELLRQHEYKDHGHLLEIFKGRSKTGTGDGLPEAILVDRATLQPIGVIEAKATIRDLDKAVAEVTNSYGKSCVDAGFNPLAIAVAGTSEGEFAVRVFKWSGESWLLATYEGNAIGWIPNRIDADRLRVPRATAELRPSVPQPEVLAAKADEINRLLRESSVNDRSRPAVVGACMLALWKSRGNLRKDPAHILQDINQSCAEAFWKAHKPGLSKSLVVDEANVKLAVKARRIISILELLNVAVLTAEHDYLGQLYETFFQYAGGNTIGQYFTPRHIASFCADLLSVSKSDIVLDPACGTGGFLIAAMNRIAREHQLSRAQMVKLVQKRLIGFDDEPVTAALCVANMILRGDGSSSVHGGDCFTAEGFPVGKASVVLMNPPFPHKKTDTPAERFVERALEGLAQGGRLAVIIPLSTLVKKDKRAWRESILAKHTLEAAIKLPDELFQPYAAANTVVVYLTKGIPHPKTKSVFFARIENDGFRMKKGVRIPCPGSEISKALAAFEGKETKDGFCGWAPLDKDLSFAPGAYIPASTLSVASVELGVLEIVRARTAFVAYHAPQLVTLNQENQTSLSTLKNRAVARKNKVGSLGFYFDIFYGLKALHNKEGLLPGNSLVISSSGMDNGCYGFFDFSTILKPPFVTVPSTGSIGIAHVQEWPCGVTDDCLVLLPKPKVPQAYLYIASAVLRSESWRFSYGRKATPDRIADFLLPVHDATIGRINEYIQRAEKVENMLLADAEDAIDTRIGQIGIDAIKSGAVRTISGEALEARLALLEAEQ